jgi:hypothetical protein
MQWLQVHGAGVCGEEVLFGCILYILLRLTANREQFRFW